MPAAPTAAQILEQVTAKYASACSYQDVGERRTVFIPGSWPWRRHTDRKVFRTAFLRPQSFFFEYGDVGYGAELTWTRGVVWSNSRGVFKWSANRFAWPDEMLSTLSQTLGSFSAASGSTSERVPK